MTPTPTPRTDAESFRSCIGDWGYGEFVPASFARDIERELAECKDKLDGSEITHAATLADLRDCKRELADRAESWRMSSVCRAKEAAIARLELELSAERALADRLADALAVYKGDVEHVGHWMPAPAQNKADEALDAWKEARGA